MRLLAWKPMRRGGPVGLATVILPIRLRLLDRPTLVSDGKLCAALASKRQIDKDGRHKPDATDRLAYLQVRAHWSSSFNVSAGRISGRVVMTAAEIRRALANRIGALASYLLPGGHREGNEWRAGSLAGEAGRSLGVHLASRKAGVWCDFATGEKGDALELVRAALDLNVSEAVVWARRWLGIQDAAPPSRSASAPKAVEPKPDPDRWRHPWQAARPIAGTLAETYLEGRGLQFDDLAGRVLRFAGRRARKSPADELEHHPALLCVLSDARTGEQCGIINIFLKADGSDRLRDKKGKTVTGRAECAVVMLSDFDDPTMGLVLCEGVETGIALVQRGVCPIWACGAAGTLAKFPLLGGIESLTIAADADVPGQRAADELAKRWREDGREVRIVPPEVGDWAECL